MPNEIKNELHGRHPCFIANEDRHWLVSTRFRGFGKMVSPEDLASVACLAVMGPGIELGSFCQNDPVAWRGPVQKKTARKGRSFRHSLGAHGQARRSVPLFRR